MTGVSLYNPMTVLGKQAKPLDHPYKGRVVEVSSDPNHLGRIKVDIPELYGDFKEGGEGTLPWIYPRYLGKFAGLIDFSVPEKGEIVEVEFPYKNIYLGYYTNKPLYKSIWDSLSQKGELGASLKSLFTGDHYPNVYGEFDSNCTGWYIDKVTDEIFFVQGTTLGSIKLDTQGSWHLYIPKSLYINVVEDVEITVGKSVTTNIGENVNNTVSGNMTTSAANADYTITNTLNLVSTNNNITTPANNITGNVNITGTLVVTVDVLAAGISLIGHTHSVPQSPSGTQESAAPTRN